MPQGPDTLTTPRCENIHVCEKLPGKKAAEAHHKERLSKDVFSRGKMKALSGASLSDRHLCSRSEIWGQILNDGATQFVVFPSGFVLIHCCRTDYNKDLCKYNQRVRAVALLFRDKFLKFLKTNEQV